MSEIAKSIRERSGVEYKDMIAGIVQKRDGEEVHLAWVPGEGTSTVDRETVDYLLSMGARLPSQ